MKENIKINTFLIGAQKAGTSSLYDWLSQHPQIYAPIETKDYHYFHLNEVAANDVYPFDEYYEDVSNEKVVMRGAVNYVYVPEATRRIYEYNPNARLILVLRNPVKRAISAYNYFYKLGQEKEQWSEAIKRESKGLLTGVVEKSNFSYLEHGFYHDQYLNILKRFDAANVLVLFYEDMVSDKKKCVETVFDFLEIEKSFIPEFNHVNKTGTARFLWVNRFFFGNSFISKSIRPIVRMLTNKKMRILFGNWIRETNKRSGNGDNNNSYHIPLEVLNKYRLQSEAMGKMCDRDLTKIWHL